MKKGNLVVIVRRESDGQVISEVWDKSPEKNQGYARASVVIDRAKRRDPCDNKTTMNRAKMLASLLGLPYEEDLSWHCQAIKKVRCNCPVCVSEGRA